MSNAVGAPFSTVAAFALGSLGQPLQLGLQFGAVVLRQLAGGCWSSFARCISGQTFFAWCLASCHVAGFCVYLNVPVADPSFAAAHQVHGP